MGDVFGSALASEGIFALQSKAVSPVFFFSDGTGLDPNSISSQPSWLAFGSIFSAVWIVVVNSWQQTSAGFHIAGQGMQACTEITDFQAFKGKTKLTGPRHCSFLQPGNLKYN